MNPPTPPPTDLSSESSGFRFASGVEMQQRWPSLPIDQKQQSEPPRLIEINPPRGPPGTPLTVVLQSLRPDLISAKLAFNSLIVETKQMRAPGIISLGATVPPFQQINANTPVIPISVCLFDKDTVTETWPVAEFTYTPEQEPSTETNLNDRKRSFDSTLDMDTYTTVKRPEYATLFQQRDPPLLNMPSYNGFYPPPPPPPPSMSATGTYVPLTSQQVPQYASYHRDMYNNDKYSSQPRNPPGIFPMNWNLLSPSAAEFTDVLGGFDQNAQTNIQTQQPPSHQQQHQHQQAQRPPSQEQPQPRQQPQQQHAHVRPQSAVFNLRKSNVHVPTTSVSNYQPYPGLVSRANLKIIGDLDSMAKDWSPEEWVARRRLVQFHRELSGNEVRCTFHPIAQEEQLTSNDIVVSCIYWEERNDCYITSVDCIQLLERLMDIRFNVEEKNRVRRNLEGFRPLTVSKCKSDSADFFKTVMSFPNPKPRNIEKDIKVFPWRTLPYALKKIVTKYTASCYSSPQAEHPPRQQRQHQQQQQQQQQQLPPPHLQGPPPPAPSSEFFVPMTTPPSYMAHQQQAASMFETIYPAAPPPAPPASSQQQQQHHHRQQEQAAAASYVISAAETPSLISHPSPSSPSKSQSPASTGYLNAAMQNDPLSSSLGYDSPGFDTMNDLGCPSAVESPEEVPLKTGSPRSTPSSGHCTTENAYQPTSIKAEH
ncbi:hypothetical protein EC973_007343 [Apophysomyces ossiformis]|uniref:DUF7082 domain-containing protein n=1 Tax=Apophysomyces ossiformis TaxID=679940 RepID=A0A8H7BV56_9FUNG|nr:hypothetical protein EC973_007343 [Apophysomyces ossiformis]